MTNPISVVKPEVLMENKMTIRHFLQQPYYGAKRQLDEGIALIQYGVSFFGDEFSGLYPKQAGHISRMEWPVNDFLRDPD
jgi:hypothetical protein